MVLNTQSSYPNALAYVLKLHRDAAPTAGKIAGRLEHVASGRTLQFNSAEELIACLMNDAASVDVASERSGS